MVKYDDADLDVVFGALSHSARRGTLAALVDGARSVSDLAAPYGMSLVGFMKHVRVLEEAHLIACEKEGRVARCVLAPERIREAATWLTRYERFCDARLDALGRHLCHQKEVAPWPEKTETGKPRALRLNRHYDATSEEVWRASKKDGATRSPRSTPCLLRRDGNQLKG